MYTKIKNVQILVSLLKQHNIRHLVLSAGTRHVPLAHSVENDDFFHCYSVVDERSAGYFALGLAKELGEPVAIACTSSTATCNYTPPIAEAFYQKVPLLILTGDRDPYLLNQLEDQMINQIDMYKNFCKKCVNLPLVKNEYDIWYCQRLVNEAILELNHHGSGPVQINFPINQSIEDIADASIPKLPEYNKIERCELGRNVPLWEQKVEQLKRAKRILVLVGSSAPASTGLEVALDAFSEHYNCIISTEHLSNLHCKCAVNTYLIAEAMNVSTLRELAPDIVIFFGGNFMSRLKIQLRDIKSICESWVINDDGSIMDPFQSLKTVFECPVEYFFKYFAAQNASGTNNKILYDTFLNLRKEITFPDPYTLAEKASQRIINDTSHAAPKDSELISENYLSAFLAIYGLSKSLPKEALLHLSILNSTRITQMFDLDPSITVFSNIGTDGIDGSMSTFLGQARVHPDRPCFLIIGDLSFFYDMNALGIRDIGPNIHILLINNGGGSEFYFSMGPGMLPNIDQHIAAAHQHSAKEWVLANNFRYLCAHDVQEYQETLPVFLEGNPTAPVIMEVFTDKKNDIKILKEFQELIYLPSAAEKKVAQMKNNPFIRYVIKTKAGQSLKNGIKRIHSSFNK